MVRAFIMAKTAVGESGRPREAVTDHSGVREAHVVAGTYDMIVEAEAETVYDLLHGIATGVRGLDGVVDTRTYICLE